MSSWVKRDRDFFLVGLLFSSAIQCVGFIIYALALADGWISYQPQTSSQSWLSWSTYAAIGLLAHLLNGLTQSWLIGARVRNADAWFYIVLLSGTVGLVFNSLFAGIFGIPAFARPRVNLMVDLFVGFVQAFFLRRFSPRAFV